ncbi:hypothetical protein T296_23420 [Pantoea agglomerans Eh318]|nr:hypothetical protein T296_23420 [Pantoea agglomerans Eh318]
MQIRQEWQKNRINFTDQARLYESGTYRFTFAPFRLGCIHDWQIRRKCIPGGICTIMIKTLSIATSKTDSLRKRKNVEISIKIDIRKPLSIT